MVLQKMFFQLEMQRMQDRRNEAEMTLFCGDFGTIGQMQKGWVFPCLKNSSKNFEKMS
jgi:hypothetical protein